MRKMVLLLLFLITITVSAQETDHHVFTLTHNGVDRLYHVHLPENYNPDEPTPLLMVLHPMLSSANAIAGLTGFNQSDMIVVYPQAADAYWDDGRTAAGVPPVREPVDDIGFLNVLLDQLEADYNVSGVYLAGMENGGTMAYRMACEVPERFEAVAVVNTLLWQYHVENCPTATAPVNMFIVIGTENLNYPLEGRVVLLSLAESFKIFSLEETLAFWNERNACTERTDNEQTIVLSGCDNNDTTVAVYIVPGGGNNWYRTGDYGLNQVGVNATEMILAYFNGDDTWQAAPTREVTYEEGPPRTYRMYVPSTYSQDVPMPAVLALHGRTQNGAAMALTTEMNFYAERDGYIAIYPDGIDGGWSYLGDLMPSAFDSRVDDTIFLPQLIDDLAQDFNIDQSRVYVTGFSNGGFMTLRLACENYDDFAAFAVVGAAMYINMQEHCEGSPPVPILFINGTQDISTRWDGVQQEIGNGQFVMVSYSIIDTLIYWVQHNGCEPIDTSLIISEPEFPNDTGLIYSRFEQCADNAPAVEIYIVQNGGHNWMGVEGVLDPSIAGLVNTDLHATEAIWAFFQRHHLD